MIKFIFSFPQWSRILISLFYLGIVALISLMPADDVPDVQLFTHFDKMVHGCMYFGLTMLACWTFHSEENRLRILYIVLFSITWGMLMEISQFEMMVGRSFDLTDELANGIGTLLGASVYALIAGYHLSRRGDLT